MGGSAITAIVSALHAIVRAVHAILCALVEMVRAMRALAPAVPAMRAIVNAMPKCAMQCTVHPFRECLPPRRNAGQTFQRFIDGALQGLDFCFAYVDDVLVASSSPEQHREHLKILFERFATYGIIVNVGKSVLGAPYVAFLGFEISAGGTRALPDRIAALKDFPQPATARGLRRYLGVLNFYRRHLAHSFNIRFN